MNCRRAIGLHEFAHMDMFVTDGQKRAKSTKHKFSKPRDCIEESRWLSDKGCMQCNDSKIHMMLTEEGISTKTAYLGNHRKNTMGIFKDEIYESLVKRWEIPSCIREANIP